MEGRPRAKRCAVDVLVAAETATTSTKADNRCSGEHVQSCVLATWNERQTFDCWHGSESKRASRSSARGFQVRLGTSRALHTAGGEAQISIASWHSSEEVGLKLEEGPLRVLAVERARQVHLRYEGRAVYSASGRLQIAR